MPYVFTEQGISMLSGVLHSDIAVAVSIKIMRAFVEMRHFIANNALLFERISNIELRQLAYEKRQMRNLNRFLNISPIMQNPSRKSSLPVRFMMPSA